MFSDFFVNHDSLWLLRTLVHVSGGVMVLLAALLFFVTVNPPQATEPERRHPLALPLGFLALGLFFWRL